MKRLIIVTALFVAACAEPQVAPYKSDAVILPTVEIHATREQAEEPSKAPKATARLNVSTCKDINVGDGEQSFRLKLDCVLSLKK